MLWRGRSPSQPALGGGWVRPRAPPRPPVPAWVGFGQRHPKFLSYSSLIAHFPIINEARLRRASKIHPLAHRNDPQRTEFV